MPLVQIGKENVAHILVVGEYQPGDLPPEGYLEWHEWAEVQRKAGVEQVPCAHCAKWKTPQELSEEIHVSHCTDSKGNPVDVESAVCTNCFNKRKLAKENL